MTKFTLGLLAALMCTASGAAHRNHSAGAAVLSAAPDNNALAPQWRVDFVPGRANPRPPFAGRLLVYRAGQATPAQVISVTSQVELDELQLSMPDVDGDGHPDLIFAGVRDRVFRRQADAVYLWSAPRGQFIHAPDLSRRGTVFPSEGKPGCVSAEFWCSNTGIDLVELCRAPAGGWVKTPNSHSVCEDRD